MITCRKLVTFVVHNKALVVVRSMRRYCMDQLSDQVKHNLNLQDIQYCSSSHPQLIFPIPTKNKAKNEQFQ